MKVRAHDITYIKGRTHIISALLGVYATRDAIGSIRMIYVSKEFGGYPVYDNGMFSESDIPDGVEWDEIHLRMTSPGTNEEWMEILK